MSSAKFPPIVLDTNVFISAAILPNSTSAKALLVALEKFEVNLSESTWTELLQVIGRPKLNRYIDDEGRHEFLQRIVRSSRFIETKSNIKDRTDPKDNLISPQVQIHISAYQKYYFLVLSEIVWIEGCASFSGLF